MSIRAGGVKDPLLEAVSKRSSGRSKSGGVAPRAGLPWSPKTRLRTAPKSQPGTCGHVAELDGVKVEM